MLTVPVPSGRTRVVGVIGDPVGHSLSPRLHNAAFSALGLDWVYVAFNVPRGAAAAALAAVRTLGLGGLSVTMPHKSDVAGALDRLTDTAARLGAVNTVVARRAPSGSCELSGDNTDGPGLLAALRHEHGFDPDGKRALLLGTGGAARAVALALEGAGAGSVRVVGRRPEAVRACAALAPRSGRPGTVAEVSDADLVVQATPLGMALSSGQGRARTDGLPFGLDPGRLGAGQLAVDLVYSPPVTPFIAAARAQRATTANGLGMLVHQAALQFRAWTGEEAPIDLLLRTARSA